jgi:hypothetical protein
MPLKKLRRVHESIVIISSSICILSCIFERIFHYQMVYVVPASHKLKEFFDIL